DDVDAAAGLPDLGDDGVEDLPVVDELDRVAALQADGGGLIERVGEVGSAVGSLGCEVHLADRFPSDSETRRAQESERESGGVPGQRETSCGSVRTMSECRKRRG